MAGNITPEKVDLLIYGPIRPILENGFSDQYVLHTAENRGDLERLSPETAARLRGMAVTYHTVPANRTALAMFPKLEIIASFGVGYDHVDSSYAREHNIVVTNTPDVLTEEVADVAMGLLIATLREFVKADRYLRSGLWQSQNYPLSVGSLRDRKVGNIEKLKPDVIAAGNIGCMTQIAAGTTIPVVHTVELIDWATGGPAPQALMGPSTRGSRVRGPSALGRGVDGKGSSATAGEGDPGRDVPVALSDRTES